MANRKLTNDELKRNRLYASIGNASFSDYKVIGHVKQGLLLRDTVNNQDVIVKTILKKVAVDFEKEQIERPTEQVKEETKNEPKAKAKAKVSIPNFTEEQKAQMKAEREKGKVE